MGIKDKLNTKQGVNIISPIIIGNNIVQHSDINWSYLILGNEALVHINTNINIQDLNPNVKLNIIPSKIKLKKLVPVSNKNIISELK